jgi:hypothetical protein
MVTIIHLTVFKKMRPFVASSGHAQILGNLDFLHRLLEGGLDRLGDILGRLAGNGLEVLGLLDGHLDALAQERGLQFDDFRQRLGADQGFEMREAGLGIGAQGGNGLERQIAGNGLGGLVARLQSLLGLFGTGLQLGIGLFRLLNALFGESADLVGCLGSVEARELNVFDGIGGLGPGHFPSFSAAAALTESRLVHV